jgi:HSP20 family protein
MNLIQWRRREPTPMSTLRDEMDRLFGRLWTGAPFDGGELGAWAPALNVSETEDEIRVEAELPGIKPEEVDVNVHGDVLTITGERKAEQEDKGRSYHRIERRYGQFVRSLQLPAEVDAGKVSAVYEKGMLIVTLPKSAQSKPRKIEIKEQK